MCVCMCVKVCVCEGVCEGGDGDDSEGACV